jgi:hypothetical protein
LGARLRQLYTIESWALAVLGAVHMATTFRIFEKFSQPAVWFLGAGLLMVFAAGLNLLNRTYGRIAPGLRIVCIAANISMLTFAVAAGLAGRAGIGQWMLVLGIIGPLVVLSCLRSVNGQDAA